MEHLGLHAAAHVFFENKLDDLTSEFNGKIKKVQAFVQKELRKLHDIHMGEVKKLKHELRILKDEVVELRKLEDDITHTGMSQIRRLSKEVKEEVHDIKRIKGEEEITDIKHHEEDITHVGMHQMHKMNKEMKSEVKQVKNQIKSLKREVMDAKENSRKREESSEEENVSSLNLTAEEIDELLAVRESVHRAFEKSLKPPSESQDAKMDEGKDVEENPLKDVEENPLKDVEANPLNLWLLSPNKPSAASDDALQLSRTVILYVKARRGHGESRVSSHPSLQWSSHEEDNQEEPRRASMWSSHEGDNFLSSAPVTRNSSFDAAGGRGRMAQGKAGSQDFDEEDAQPHLQHHHPQHEAQVVQGHHTGGHFHHSHLTSALHEVQGDSIPLTPVLSEDEEDVEESNKSSEEKMLIMRIDKVPADKKSATKSGQPTEKETSDGESIERDKHSGEEQSTIKAGTD